jgi:L-fuculose-phosphate aldolase
MAYAVAGIRPDVRTIPESWILLQDLPLAPAGLPVADPRAFAGMFGPRSPAVLVANEGITLGGATLLEAFDRLEVAEFSARSLLLARSLGTVQPIDDAQVEALRKKFFPS